MSPVAYTQGNSANFIRTEGAIFSVEIELSTRLDRGSCVGACSYNQVSQWHHFLSIHVFVHGTTCMCVVVLAILSIRCHMQSRVISIRNVLDI